MDEITRFVVEAVCVSVFVVTLAVSGVSVQPRLLLVLRYAELRAARFPSLDLPQPRLRSFILRPLLVLLALGGPSLTLFLLVRGAQSWPRPVSAIALMAVWPAAAALLAWLSARSPWARVRETLTIALAMPDDRREEVLPDAFPADPQLLAAEAVGERTEE